MSKFFKVTVYEDDWNKDCTFTVTTRTNLEILADSEEDVKAYLNDRFSDCRWRMYDIVETNEEFYKD
jgi:hypothetical protein